MCMISEIWSATISPKWGMRSCGLFFLTESNKGGIVAISYLLVMLDGGYSSQEDGNRQIWAKSTEGNFSVTTLYTTMSDDALCPPLVASIWKFKAP